jgi:hypothetical protein
MLIEKAISSSYVLVDWLWLAPGVEGRLIERWIDGLDCG